MKIIQSQVLFFYQRNKKESFGVYVNQESESIFYSNSNLFGRHLLNDRMFEFDRSRLLAQKGL